MITILNHILFMHRAYVDFQTIHVLVLAWGRTRVQDLLLRGETLNQNRFWSNSRAERTQRGVQGPAQGLLVSLVGSRGSAPGSSWVFRVLRHQNASLHIIFFHFPDKFCCKVSWHVDIRYSMINLVQFISDRPIYSHREVDLSLTLMSDLLAHRGVLGMCPMRSWEILYFWKWDRWWILFYTYLVNTVRRKFRTGDGKNTSQPHLLLLYVYLIRCLISVCSTHIVQAVFFIFQYIPTKKMTVNLKRNLTPTQPTPTLEKKYEKRLWCQFYK